MAAKKFNEVLFYRAAFANPAEFKDVAVAYGRCSSKKFKEESDQAWNKKALGAFSRKMFELNSLCESQFGERFIPFIKGYEEEVWLLERVDEFLSKTRTSSQ